MAVMLDTSVAIHLRDGDPNILTRIKSVRDVITLPMVTLAELEAGVRGEVADIRRAQLDILLDTFEVVPFLAEDARIYGEIVAAAGFSRRKVLDRMIAAQALRAKASLATMNADDFRDIPGLTLLEW